MNAFMDYGIKTVCRFLARVDFYMRHLAEGDLTHGLVLAELLLRQADGFRELHMRK